MNVLELIFIVFAAILAIPLVVLFVECVMALLPARKAKSAETTPRSTILMPAHNEEAVIGEILEQLQPHLSDQIDLLVIADNCSDATAEIARSKGATVLERFHDTDRGKGFALDYGMTHLSQNPPEIVVMMDADCTVEAGGIEKIARTAKATNRPVQAVYLQKTPDNPGGKDYISAFAFLVKNLVRPKGLYNLGQPALLTGSGMAFPWEIIRNAPLASGNIVEDMQLGYDLALAGHSPLLAPDVTVWGELPQQRTAATTQRTRWEHGHIQTLISQCPRLIKGAVTNLRFDLLALALDLFIPPLALLVLLWLVGVGVTAMVGLLGVGWLPVTILGIAGLMLMVAIGISWVGFGRNTIPLTKLLSIPLYIVWKVPLYLKFLVQRQTAWVRTERDSSKSPSMK